MNELEFFTNQITKYLTWFQDTDIKRFKILTSMASSGYLGKLKAGTNIIEVAELHQTAHKGVLCVLWAMDIYIEESKTKQNDGYNNESPYFPISDFYELILIAQDHANYKNFASKFIAFNEITAQNGSKNLHETIELFLALSYLILDDTAMCMQHLAQATMVKKHYGGNKGYHEVITGIMEKDAEKIKQGLEIHLKWYNRDRESRDSVGFPYCFAAMGFINFARFKGIKIELESPNIHPDLIKELPKDFVYEGIPEVYEAIQIADNKRSGVLGRLKNIFK